MIKKVILFILFFLLIYKPEFIFIPHSINLFFGIIGFIFYLKNKSQNSNSIRVFTISSKKKAKKLLSFAIPFVLVSFVSILINYSFDFYYPRYAISLFWGFCTFYLTALLFKDIYGNITVEKITDYFVLAECFFLLIGLISFFSPDFYNLMASLQKYNYSSVETMDRTEGSRLISIGAQFFTAAIINGFVLILIGIRLLYCNNSIKTRVLYLFAFAFITIIGMMMARSTMIGAALGGVFICFSFLPGVKNVLSSLSSMVFVLLLGWLLFVNIGKSVTNDFDDLYTFGFEMFINYNSGEGFSARSNNALFDMYNTLPTDIKSWLIGDAKWAEGNHYYKRVDAGYLRPLWYFGIFGMICLFGYYLKVIHYIVYKGGVFYGKKFLPTVVLFIYVLILNYKGPVDLYFLLLPFVFCDKISLSYEKI